VTTSWRRCSPSSDTRRETGEITRAVTSFDFLGFVPMPALYHPRCTTMCRAAIIPSSDASKPTRPLLPALAPSRERA
jgi:hypothetical protein